MGDVQAETVKKTGKGKGRKNAVGDFFVAKVDGKLMRAFVKEHKLGEKVDLDGTDEQVAVALVSHFREAVPKADQVRCDNCDAISSADLESCPFCGDTGDVEGAEAGAESDPDIAAVTDAEDEEEEDEEEEDEEEEEEEEEEEDDEDEKQEAAPAPPPATETAGKKKAKKAKEGAAMQTAGTTAANGAKKGEKSTALAKAEPAGKLSARDLDKAVAEVAKLKTANLECYWQLGKKVLEINEKQLWKLRTDDAGKKRYASFEAFVHHELNMSTAHAYNAIDAAKNYGSAEEIRELGGASKAVLILKAAPEDRERLKAKAKAGATKRQLAAEVKESRKKHGSPKKGQQAKAGAKSGAAKQKSAEKITVSSIEGVRTIKLYKKPEKMKGVDLSKEKRAASLGDLPYGVEELANGVVRHYYVSKKDGELVLKIQTVREDA